MAIFKSAFAGGGRGNTSPRCPLGIDWVHFSVAIPTTAIDSTDEQVLLYKFPDDGDVWLFRGGNSLDTDDTLAVLGADFSIGVTDVAASALVWDLGIGDVDGVIDTSLISGSVVGVTAGQDYITTIAEPLDVSGKYLIFDVTTAAVTPAAGTITVRMKVAFGKKLEVDTSLA